MMTDQTNSQLTRTFNHETTLAVKSVQDDHQLYPALPSPPETNASTSGDTETNSDQQRRSETAMSSSTTTVACKEESPSQHISSRFASLLERAHQESKTSNYSKLLFNQKLSEYEKELQTLRKELDVVHNEKSKALVDYTHSVAIREKLEGNVKLLEQELERLKLKLREETERNVSVQHHCSDLQKAQDVLKMQLSNEQGLVKQLEVDVAELRRQVSNLENQKADETTKRIHAENNIVSLSDTLEFYQRQLDQENKPENILTAVNEFSMTEAMQEINNVHDTDHVQDAVQTQMEAVTIDLVEHLTDRYKLKADTLEMELSKTKDVLKEVREDYDIANETAVELQKEYKSMRDKLERIERHAAADRAEYVRKLEELSRQFGEERAKFDEQTEAYSFLMKEKQTCDVQLKLLEEIVKAEESKFSKTSSLSNSPAAGAGSGGSGSQCRPALKRKDTSAASSPSGSPVKQQQGGASEQQLKNVNGVSNIKQQFNAMSPLAKRLKPATAQRKSLHLMQSAEKQQQKSETTDAAQKDSCMIM